eukprot:TRINITY_DN3008_c0_g3_i2.p1 TRINITY_DN3008_c0_g3~~TRINITY_DN3008_c0_g3_i2.p1  ORF type:complete len:731 (-),score=149.10 TRINITY_DN3008_c0_g3_i2:1261-3369(-)
MEREIGKGAYGTIYEGYWDDQLVAIKTLDAEIINEETKREAFNDFRHEVYIMSGLNHPNLVNILAFSTDTFSIVMELLPYGNLFEFINNPESPRDWEISLKIAIDTAIGMKYLHELNPPFIHQDLKSPNILLLSLYPNSPICAKVADFGLTTRLYVPALRQKNADRDVVNPTWLAPEVMKELPYTGKVDVYSFGIVLWELIARQYPFSNLKCDFMFEQEDAIKSGSRPPLPDFCPEDLADLIRECWDGNPDLRPEFSEIVVRLVDMVWMLAPGLKLPDNILLKDYITEEDGYVNTEEVLFEGRFLRKLSSNNDSKYYTLCVLDDQIWAGRRGGLISCWDNSGIEVALIECVDDNKPVCGIHRCEDFIWTLVERVCIRIWTPIGLKDILISEINEETMTTLEGYLYIEKQLRFVQLRTKNLYVFRNCEEYTPIYIINIDDAVIQEKKKAKLTHKNPISLTDSNGKVWSLSWEHSNDRTKWVDAIEGEKNRKKQAYQLHLACEMPVQNITCMSSYKNEIWLGGWGFLIQLYNGVTFEIEYDSSQIPVDISEYIDEDINFLAIGKILPNEEYLWLAVSNNIIKMRKSDMKCLGICKGHTAIVSSIVEHNGKLWSCGEDFKVIIWNPDTFECVRVITPMGPEQKLFSLYADFDGVFCGSRTGLYFFTEDGDERELGIHHTDAISSIVRCGTSIWSASWDGTLSVWR